jgi:hypothetical protein
MKRFGFANASIQRTARSAMEVINKEFKRGKGEVMADDKAYFFHVPSFLHFFSYSSHPIGAPGGISL